MSEYTVTAQQAQNIVSLCDGLWSFAADEEDKNEYIITIETKDETRGDAQNKLMWHWNREVAEHIKLSNDFVHGKSKLDILLPLYLGWGGKRYKRGVFIHDVLSRLTEYKFKVAVAYDMIRTNDLGVKKFTEYLDCYSGYWATEGVILTTSEDYYFEAMGLTK